MEDCNHIIIYSFFNLMSCTFQILVKDALLGFFVFNKDLILKEIHETHIISILNILFNNRSFSFVIFICLFTLIKINITEFTSNLIFSEVSLNHFKTQFLSISSCPVFIVEVWFSWQPWIFEEDSVVSMQTFENISVVISFHFEKRRLKNILALLLGHIFKWYDASFVVEEINKLVEVFASLNDVKLTFSNVV